MTKRLVLLLVMAALASTAAPSFAEQGRTRIVTKNYRLGFMGEFTLICDNSGDLLQSDPAIGGACFNREFGERTMTITVEDNEDLPVAGAYFLTDPLGRDWGYGWFCETVVVNVPPGPTDVDVYTSAEGMTGSIPFWNMFFLGPDCGLEYRPATEGTITAEFYRPWL